MTESGDRYLGQLRAVEKCFTTDTRDGVRNVYGRKARAITKRRLASDARDGISSQGRGDGDVSALTVIACDDCRAFIVYIVRKTGLASSTSPIGAVFASTAPETSGTIVYTLIIMMTDRSRLMIFLLLFMFDILVFVIIPSRKGFVYAIKGVFLTE